MDIELKHTWHISRQAWYIRLYLWVWGGSEKEITFCKLWWAYVFMWFGLPVQCAITGSKAFWRGLRWSGRQFGRALAVADHYGEAWLVASLGLGYQQYTSVANRYRSLVREEALTPKRPEVHNGAAVLPAQPLHSYDGPSVIEFLRGIRKTKVSEPSSPFDVTVSCQRKPFLQLCLSAITLSAAWLGMRKQAISYRLRTVVGRKARAWIISPIIGDLIEIALGVYEYGYDLALACKRKSIHTIRRTGWLLVDWVVRPIVWTIRTIYRGVAVCITACITGLAWVVLSIIDALLIAGKAIARTFPMLATIGNAILDVLLIVVARPLWWFCSHVLWPPIDKGLDLLSHLEGPATILGAGLAGLMIVGYIVIGVMVLITMASHVLSTPSAILIGFGITWGVFIIGLLAAWLMTKFITKYLAPAVNQAVLKPAAKATVVTLGAGEQSVVGFGKIMTIGYKAVKSNTCPKVEIEE